MPPKHIAQTSTEVKKAYKKNGPAVSDRTHKQLQRGYELEQRAAREREAERRRKLAKEKRIEKERKEEQIRKQIGVGLATQLIGYSHTQANLKKGMEAFLGINKKQEEERRRKEEEKRREEELAKTLEVIAQDIETEPFDDDEDIDDAMLDLPLDKLEDLKGWVDDELDDDTLLEAHDLVMSDPIEDIALESIPNPPRSTTPLPSPQRQCSSEICCAKSSMPVHGTWSVPHQPDAACEDIEFTRTHGPVNKTVESVLERLPGDFIELLSQDTAATTPEWAPSHSLLYKLNPVGLPPHRLRVKVGCVVVCLKDQNTSSQLSKSQHVQILRVENERLECLTLDGQLAGTKTVITRVPFPAKYRNDDKFPFTRTQYPVRVATDYISANLQYCNQTSAFKLPSINGKARPPTWPKKPTPPMSNLKSQADSNLNFKLPSFPASRIQAPHSSKTDAPLKPTTTTLVALDGWDEFLESSTQIAREILADAAPKHSYIGNNDRSSIVIEPMPPPSTQDLDFSMDDLDDEASIIQEYNSTVLPSRVAPQPAVKAAILSRHTKSPLSVKPGPLSRTANIRRLKPEPAHAPSPVRLPKAVQQKVKRPMAPPPKPLPPAKRPCLAAPPFSTITTSTTNSRRCNDFGMSTQEASSFFDDDDDLTSASPPIAV